MSNKGQVTVFIIIGIIILAVFALILYISNITTSGEFETEGRPVTDTVPQEFVAIQEYTETCLGSVAEQGILILGQQGGHLYPSSLGYYSTTDMTNSDGINMDPILVPYWHYNALENGNSAVSVASLQPALYDDDENYVGGTYMSIESQLARFVEEEIEDCLNKYEVFVGQNFEISYDSSDAGVTSRVWDGHVDFIMEMPLDVSRDEAGTEMNTFYTDLDVDLKHIYEIADEITGAEVDSTFLENQVIDLLLVHTGEDVSKFAPFQGVGLNDYNYLVWTSSDLQNKLEEMLSTYVPITRYYNSNNYIRYVYPVQSETTSLTQKISDNMILPLEGADDLDVTFDYFGWDTYFNINGGQEEVTPVNIFVDLPGPIGEPIVFQQYYNSYDFSYPVLVTLNDPEAFNGKGYTFNFALEANVINNKPVDPEYVQPATLLDPAQSLVCDKDHFDTGMLKSIIVDAYTYEPLELVKIGFDVPNSDYCNIGVTDEEGTLEANYPSVYGGVMDFYVDGYLRSYLPADTYPLKGQDGIIGFAIDGLDYEVVYLYQKKPVTVNIMKKNLEKCIVPKVCNLDKEECEEYANRKCFFNSGNGLFLSEPDWEIIANGSMTYLNEYYFIDSAKPLEDDEKAVFTLDRVSPVEEHPFVEEDYSISFVIEGDDTTEIELVPGIYSVTAQFLSQEELTILNDLRCPGTDDKDNCVNFTETEVASFITSMDWDTYETYFTILEDDLYNSNTLTFFSLANNVKILPDTVTSYDEDGNEVEIRPLIMEDLHMMSYSSNVSRTSKVRNGLEPEWDFYIEEEIGEEELNMLATDIAGEMGS